ncbi:autotransporter domain-containing protein, partial [Deltaproteobacteria bacterium OttesenSCG-928-K17]|nr:autotransporter domain-containing protein [Deltaproteobacteria bacterium OttesenSCG-928-K17]
MTKPRNKTTRRRLHYLGMLATAGLLTVGASPLSAQTAAPTDINGIAGPAVIAGTWTDDTNAEVTVDLSDGGSGLTNVTFGKVTNSDSSGNRDVKLDVNTADASIGSILQDETGEDVAIYLNGKNLAVTGNAVADTTHGITVTNSGSGSFSADNDLQGKWVLNTGSTLGSIGLLGATDITAGGTVTASGNIGGDKTVSIANSTGTFEQTNGTLRGTVNLDANGQLMKINNIGNGKSDTIIGITGAVTSQSVTAINKANINIGANSSYTQGAAGTVSGTVNVTLDAASNTSTLGVIKNGAEVLLDGSATNDAYKLKATKAEAGSNVTLKTANLIEMNGNNVNIDGAGTISNITGLNNTINGLTGVADVATIQGGIIDSSAAAIGLTIGDQEAVTVDVQQNIIGDASDKSVTIVLNDGSVFKQTSGTTKGYVNVTNNSDDAENFTLNKLNGANLNITGDIRVGDGLAGGATNTLNGTGNSVYMAAATALGTTGTINLNGITVKLDGDAVSNISKGVDISVNTTTGAGGLDASALTNSGSITLTGDVSATLNGYDALFKANSAGLIFNHTTNGVTVTGTIGDSVIFDGSAGTAGIKYGNGLNINLSGNGASVDFKGNQTINAANNNSLQAPIINISDSVFTVVGRPLRLANSGTEPATTMNLTGDVEFNFSSGGNGIKGFTNDVINKAAIKSLNIGVDGETGEVSFTKGYFTTQTADIKGDTVFKNRVKLVESTAYADNAGNSGLYITGDLNVDNQMVYDGPANGLDIDAGFSDSDGNVHIHFTNPGGYTGGLAIDLQNGAGFTSVDAVNYFDLGGATASGAFTVIGSSDNSVANLADIWNKFDYAGPGYNGYNTAAAIYNKGNGQFTYLAQADAKTAVDATPKYGQGYTNALLYNHTDFGDLIGNGYFGNGAKLTDVNGNPFIGDAATGHRILNQAMGHTLNAVRLTANPMSGIINNLNTMHPQTENRIAHSAGDTERFGLWATPNFSYTSVDGNYSRGLGGDFTVKNYGVTLGFDAWANDRFRLGVFGSYNSGKLDGDYEDIESDDIQLGVYGQAALPEGFMLNVGFAYGWQDYNAKRDIYGGPLNAYNQRIKSDFDGNTITASVELNKAFALDYNMFLRPSLGYTYIGNELDGYTERSNAAPGFSLAQKTNDTDFDLHLFRAGTDIGWSGEYASIVGRLYWVGNAG